MTISDWVLVGLAGGLLLGRFLVTGPARPLAEGLMAFLLGATGGFLANSLSPNRIEFTKLGALLFGYMGFVTLLLAYRYMEDMSGKSSTRQAEVICIRQPLAQEARVEDDSQPVLFIQ